MARLPSMFPVFTVAGALLLLACASLPAQHVEAEWNGGPDYAEPIGAATNVSGVLASSFDSDWFRFVSGGSAYAITRNSAAWVLHDHDGRMLHRSSTAITRTVYVPPGEHCLEVALTLAANTAYTVDLVPLSTVVTPLSAGPNPGSTSVDLNGTQSFHSFALANPSRVVVASNVGATIELLRQDGRLLLLRASLDVDLPAGAYFVRVLHTVATPCSISLTTTPTPLTDLYPGTREPVSIQTGGAMRLFRLDVPVPCLARIQTYSLPGGQTDTELLLYDRNLRVLAAGDDPIYWGTEARLEVPLPAGSYYVGAFLFWPTWVGSFEIDVDCSAPFPSLPVAGYGTTVVASPGNGVVGAFAFDVCTPTSVTLTATTTTLSPNQIIDSCWTVIDDTGVCTGINGYDFWVNVPNGQWGSGVRCTRPAAGRNYVLVSRDHWNPFQYSVAITSPLACDNGQLTAHGRPGDFCLLAVSSATMPPLHLGQLGISGSTCLDLSTLFVLGVQPYSSQGDAVWLPCGLTPYGVTLQHIDVLAQPVGPYFAAARDVLPF